MGPKSAIEMAVRSALYAGQDVRTPMIRQTSAVVSLPVVVMHSSVDVAENLSAPIRQHAAHSELAETVSLFFVALHSSLPGRLNPSVITMSSSLEHLQSHGRQTVELYRHGTVVVEIARVDENRRGSALQSHGRQTILMEMARVDAK